MATNLRDILNNLQGPATTFGSAIGSAWGPAGTAAGGAIGGSLGALARLGTSIYDWATGYEEPQTEEEQAQQEVLQMLRGRLGQGTEGITQEARRSFEQETVPEILERIAGGGQGRGNALALALGQAGQGLESRLAGLRENIQRGRLGDLSSYLSGQQNVGLKLQELGQRQREAARSTIGQGIPYGAQVSQGEQSRAQAAQNAQQQRANIGLGKQAYPITQEARDTTQGYMNVLNALNQGRNLFGNSGVTGQGIGG